MDELDELSQAIHIVFTKLQRLYAAQVKINEQVKVYEYLYHGLVDMPKEEKK
jgi:hypothetical protein